MPHPLLLELRIRRSPSTTTTRTFPNENICGTITSVGATQDSNDRSALRIAPERKACLFPEQLINDFSGETSAHHRIPLFDARRLHGLDINASNYRAEYILISMLSLRIDITEATPSGTKRCGRLGTSSIAMWKIY